MISDIFTMSLDALRSRKIRTFLTLLGVIIGTGSVIIVATAGNSLKVYVKDQWNVFDPTSIIIAVGTASKPPQITFTEKVFTDTDVKKIEGLPHIKGVAPVGIIAFKKVMIKEGFLKWQTKQGGTMWASTPGLLEVLNLKLTRGEIFHEGKNEIMISEGTAQMFGKDNSLEVGDTLYVQQITLRIIKAKIVGIYNSSSETNILNQLTVPAMIGPVDPYYKTFFSSNVGGLLRKVTAYNLLYATAVDTESVNKAQEEILEYLNGGSEANKYKDEKTDFVIITQEYIQDRIEQILTVVNMFITAIAVVSLIVGGIGIANIMFATVTERTREIGTMMAIGAKRRIIMQLFLYQSAIIGLLGGILGCIIGASGGAFIIQILGNYVQELGFSTSSAHLPLIYPMEWFVIATISGLLVGIIAGVIPARKAAKMDPVVALRHE